MSWFRNNEKGREGERINGWVVKYGIRIDRIGGNGFFPGEGC
jgi:hypothetical protein